MIVENFYEYFDNYFNGSAEKKTSCSSYEKLVYQTAEPNKDKIESIVRSLKNKVLGEDNINSELLKGKEPVFFK